MHWNEKINLVKEKYSQQEFSVPQVDRKSILRKIESSFIKRPKTYYDLNHTKLRFSNWWEHVGSEQELSIGRAYQHVLHQVLSEQERYWVAFEFEHGEVLLYKATLSPILYLSSVGKTWTRIIHIIGMKYDYMISLNMVSAQETVLKVFGSTKAIEEEITNKLA